jgi:hypothetical protein
MNNRKDSSLYHIIDTYSRRQALADGEQVDVTKLAREIGIGFPVFLTRAVYGRFVAVPEGVESEDETGRLWDILNALHFAIRVSHGKADRLPFVVSVRTDGNRLELAQLISAR